MLLYAGKVEGCSLQRFVEATGLTLTDNDGSLKQELPPISQFLNRLLALTIDLQNTVFEAFEALLEAKIEGAIASGIYDAGVETDRLPAFLNDSAPEPGLLAIVGGRLLDPGAAETSRGTAPNPT